MIYKNLTLHRCLENTLFKTNKTLLTNQQSALTLIYKWLHCIVCWAIHNIQNQLAIIYSFIYSETFLLLKHDP